MSLDLHLLPPAVGSPVPGPAFDPLVWGLVLMLCIGAALVVLDDR